MSQPKERALFLIDGPNFYKSLQESGISKGHLDCWKLAEDLAIARDIVDVVFFTCPLRSTHPHAPAQQRFFSKLKKSGVKLRLGTLVDRKRTCEACKATEYFQAEKGVDVALAMTMVTMALSDQYDVVYLISCDADYVPAVQFVRNCNKKVFLAAPKGAKYGTLQKECNTAIPIDQNRVDRCQG